MSSASQENWDDTGFINTTFFRSDISQDESQALYKQWALSERYDSMISQPNIYSSFVYLRQSLQGVHSHPGETLVLDVGAGTGLTAMVLRDMGYTNIHGLEPQTDLADRAEQKGLYTHIIREFIDENPTKGVEADTYDLIACTGAFAPGHIPATAMKEMARVTKPGGHVVICMREEFLTDVPDYRANFQPVLDGLMASGAWQLVKREVYPHHFVDKTGVLFMFKVL